MPVRQDLHGGPGPERVVLLVAQVTAFPAGRIVGPDLVGGRAPGKHGPGHRLVARGEDLAGLGVLGGPQQFLGGLASLVDRACQHGEHGEPLAGARVHACLVAPLEPAMADRVLADRAGSHPPCPTGGILKRPLGEIEVEGTHLHQPLAVADPRDRHDAGVPGVGRRRLRRRLRLGQQPLPPCGDDSGGQAQGIDAGVVELEVLPEPIAQVVGEVPEAVVVQPRLALPQVVHQQLTHRPAGELVAVDQLLGGALAAGAQLPQPRRGLVAEDPQPTQHLVEDRDVTWPGRQRLGLGVQQLQDVADNDVVQHAALGRDDQRASLQRMAAGRRGDTGMAAAVRL
jgi:hypothetical protein